MSFILPEVPSFGGALGAGIGQGLGSGISGAMEFAKKMALEKQKSRSLVQQTKQLEKVKIMETGLGTIKRMRQLSSAAGGWTSDPIQKIKSLIPGEAQKDRAELEALGRSLIPLVAAGVPIRNQREFDEYRKIITDTNSSPPQFEGALNGIQNILERSLGEEGGDRAQKSEPKNEQKAKSNASLPVFDISNPSHKKTRDALMKKYNNDRNKVRAELEKHYSE